MSKEQYIKAVGIFYPGALSKIKKSDNILQPIFEGFTNSLESIRLLKERHNINETQSIDINLYFKADLFSGDKIYNFSKIEIVDTGIGFDDTEYKRLIDLNNNEKGFSNKGTGRVQFLHSFNKTIIDSSYRDETSSTGFRRRHLTLSKSKPYLDQNAIIRKEDGNGVELDTSHSYTKITFETILNKKDKTFYKTLSAEELKESILLRYLAHFCENRLDLPNISINRLVNGERLEELLIEEKDIPIPDTEKPLDVYYSKLDEHHSIIRTENKETLTLKSFKLPIENLKKNELILVSKGELASKIRLENIQPLENIKGNRYLFLLSGDFIDSRDSDTRGNIDIVKTKDFKKKDSLSLFQEEEVLLEDIESKTNKTILRTYEEIKKLNEEKEQNIEELQKMFLLNPDTVNTLRKKISANDSDDTILRKVYEAEAKVIAQGDAELKKQIEEVSQLNTTDDDYQTKLIEQVDELVKNIPIQNRTALTHYVARRKLILELFNKIIRKQLDVQINISKQKGAKNIDEKLLHNLIFQQSNDDPNSSDLWLLNEDYIYFKGTSEGQLGKILLNGSNIIKETLTPEEDAYRLKQQGDANLRRPDILLFPKEGKCIIIEFKSLDTNISNHLNQINRYASLINNLSKSEYNFHTYYGYLIGENIDIDDIEDNDSDFKSAHKLDFIFRPYKRIVGKFGKNDGALYTEVIKYSTLLERAITRNKIFIDKLSNS